MSNKSSYTINLFKSIIINYLYLIVYSSRHKLTSAHLHKRKKLSLAAGLSSFVGICLNPCHYVTSPFRVMPTIRFPQVGRHHDSMFFEHLSLECCGADAHCYVAIGQTLLHGQILEQWAIVAGAILLIILHQIPISTNSLVLAEAPF